MVRRRGGILYADDGSGGCGGTVTNTIPLLNMTFTRRRRASARPFVYISTTHGISNKTYEDYPHARQTQRTAAEESGIGHQGNGPEEHSEKGILEGGGLVEERKRRIRPTCCCSWNYYDIRSPNQAIDRECHYDINRVKAGCPRPKDLRRFCYMVARRLSPTTIRCVFTTTTAAAAAAATACCCAASASAWRSE